LVRAQATFGPVSPLAPNRAPALLPFTVRLTLCVVGSAVVAGWLALAMLHVRDDYRVTHVQGVWIAAAEAARAGQLYPPLFDGEHYAGTRYMPLAILVNAVAAALAGDPLMGGKILAAILMAVLLGLALVLLRGFSCPWPLAFALASAVVATAVGLQAGTTIGGDLLPVVLQVGALVAVTRARSGAAAASAGILAGLALASKLTGLWAILGIVTWMAARRQWRAAVTCAAAAVAAAALVLGAVQLFTHGRLLDHLQAFWLAGVHGLFSVALRGPNQILYNLLASASGVVVLLPLVALGALLSRSWRQLPLTHVAFAYAVLLLLVVYADVGTGSNQLLDLVVLTVLAAGHLAGGAIVTTEPRTGPILTLAVAVTVIWAAGVDLVRTVGFDVRRAVIATRSGAATPPAATVVAGMIGADEEVLAEDPLIYVASRRRPLLMDAFMLTRLDRTHPQWVDPLIAKIAARRFGLVVLVVSLEDRSLDFWWNDYHLGARVANALRASYKFDRLVGRYYLYRPVSPIAARYFHGVVGEPNKPARVSAGVGNGLPQT
jgi:hypothetical protein